MSDEMTNEMRAERAGRSVQAYIAYDGAAYGHEEPATHLQDMLCDLQHWAAANDVDFDEAVQRATGHYEAEVAEEDDCGHGDYSNWEPFACRKCGFIRSEDQ